MMEYARRGRTTEAEHTARQYFTALTTGRVHDPTVRDAARVAAGQGDASVLVRRLREDRVEIGDAVAAVLFELGGMPHSAFARLNAAVDMSSVALPSAFPFLRPLLGHDRRWRSLMRRIDPESVE